MSYAKKPAIVVNGRPLSSDQTFLLLKMVRREQRYFRDRLSAVERLLAVLEGAEVAATSADDPWMAEADRRLASSDE